MSLTAVEADASRISRALEAMASALGAQHVDTDSTTCVRAQTATYATSSRVLGVVRPGSCTEVQACVKIAGAFRVPIYPISSGKNWGYGSRAPAHGAAVLLDLCRMDRILGHDEELAWVTIEPGVTQRALYAYLQRETKGRLWIDATSASFDSSVIGNMLERGHGVTMYCDHAARAADLEVVLPSGDCIHTGYGAFENATVRQLDSWGLGPSLTSLFSQSNLGVVTRATVWLMRAPLASAVGFFSFDTDDAFQRAIDRVRALHLDRILKSGPFFGNVYQSIQKVMTYPFQQTGGDTPLQKDLALRLARAHRYDLWNGSVGLCGTPLEVEQQTRLLREAVGDLARFFVVVQPGREAEADFPPSRAAELRSVIAGFTGGIGGTGLPAAYWRVGGPPADVAEMDLDRDRCGFKFSTAVAPFRGREVREVSDIAQRLVLAHGFEPSIGIFPVRERTLHFHIATAYDRHDGTADAAILRCHEQLTDALAERGYYPSRLGVGSMDVLQRAEPAYRKLLAALQQAIDPQGIMAPGRYDPR